MLWIILTLMTALAAVGLAVPLVRRHDATRTSRNDTVEVLKAQIGEIDAQAAAGGLPPGEAEVLKADVKRRVLAEGREAGAAPPRPLSERALLGLALGLVAVVVLAATGLYLKIGRPDVSAAKPAAAGTPVADADHPQGDVASMVAMLEARMKETPGNAEGWRMLGWSYLQTNRNAEAAKAYGKAAALDPHNAEYLSAQGEATVLASEGQVTPAAEDAFRKAVSVDPADPRARYYLAIAKDQRGQHEAAMADWIGMIKDAPADAPWVPEVRAFVEKVAKERGEDLTGRLPPAPAGAAPAMAQAAPPRGPTQDQVAAAGQMTDAGRQQMIQGMVGQLAARLKANPKDRAGWEQLMRSRMVLGQTKEAAAAYRDASRAFAGSPQDQTALRQSAASLGIPGA
jgi:cytochrome c-type biogenesis protein CcmH